MRTIQGIIQSQESEGELYYHIIPSSRLGITGRCGDWISDSWVWDEVEANAFEWNEEPTHRVEVEVEDNNDGSVTVVSVTEIEG